MDGKGSPTRGSPPASAPGKLLNAIQTPTIKTVRFFMFISYLQSKGEEPIIPKVGKGAPKRPFSSSLK